MERKTEVIITIGLVFLALTGIATAASIFGTTDGTVVWDAPDGPEITTTDTDVTESVPITQDRVDLGEIEFTGSASSSVTVTSVSGSETTMSEIDSGTGILWADHIDTQRVGVEGIDSITWDQVDLDSDQPDIQTVGAGTIHVDGFDSDQFIRVEKGAEMSIEQADGSGVLTLAVENDDLTFKDPSSPELFNPSPVDEQPIDESPVSLQFDLEHDDIEDEHIDIDWYLNGDLIDTSSATEEGTISLDTSGFEEGPNTWSAEATDSTGDTATVSGSFATPATLEIRDELHPDQLVDDTETEIEVTFFGDDQSVATRTTEDGTIDMSGLPLDESFTVQVEAEGYLTRQSFARSVVERQNIYILNDTADTVETQFQVDDPTGRFDSENTRVFVKKPIERGGTTSYEVVVADELGSGGWTTTLNQGQRYLIEVEDISTGDTRELGPYVASVSELVTLEVDELQFDFTEGVGDIGYDWDAAYQNISEPSVAFQFASEETIDRFEVTIHKQYNESVTILSEEYRNHDGPIDLKAVIPEHIDNPDETNWVVEWEATIGGETFESSTLVAEGQLDPGFPGIPDTVLSVVGVLAIFVVAGFFSQANVSVGAIATSLVAAGLWVVGVIPDAVSGIFIAIALMIGVIYHVQRGQQPR